MTTKKQADTPAATLMRSIRASEAITPTKLGDALDPAREVIEEALVTVTRLHMAFDRLPTEERNQLERMRQKIGGLRRELTKLADQAARVDHIAEEIEREWPRIAEDAGIEADPTTTEG